MTEAKLARDRRLAWGIVLAAIALAAVVRFHLRGLPLERDEGELAYAGRLLLEGVPPYRLAYSMKLPGIYAVYALVMALFGRSAEGIRLGVLLATSVSTILLFRLARRFLEPLPSAAAAASFALLALSQKVLGVYGHATHFVVLAALGGLLLLPRE